MVSQRWLLEKGSQCPVDIGSARTGVATETKESVQKMMYALHSPLKNLLQALRTFILVKFRTMEVNRNGKGSTI